MITVEQLEAILILAEYYEPLFVLGYPPKGYCRILSLQCLQKGKEDSLEGASTHNNRILLHFGLRNFASIDKIWASNFVSVGHVFALRAIITGIDCR